MDPRGRCSINCGDIKTNARKKIKSIFYRCCIVTTTKEWHHCAGWFLCVCVYGVNKNKIRHIFHFFSFSIFVYRHFLSDNRAICFVTIGDFWALHQFRSIQARSVRRSLNSNIRTCVASKSLFWNNFYEKVSPI